MHANLSALLILLVFCLPTYATDGVFTQVADIQPGTEGAAPVHFKIINDYLVFAAEKEGGLGAVFSFDGNELKELVTFSPGFSVGASVRYFNDGLAEINNRRLFVLENFSFQKLMVTDGTISGTKELADIAEGQPFFLSNFFKLGSKLYFLEDGNDVSLWETDGTPEGTRVVKVLCTESMDVCNVRASLSGFAGDDKAFFFIATPANGSEPWVTDGTAAGTKVIDILPGTGSSAWLPYVDGAVMDGYFYFPADDGSVGMELFKTDGTSSGTSLVKNINLTTGSSYHNRNSRPYQFYRYDNVILFTADDGIKGEEVWVTDGTTSGTRLLVETQPGITERGDVMNYKVWKDKVIFQASKANVVSSYDIWQTDGTPEGTSMLKSLSYNFDAFKPVFSNQAQLFFLAKNIPGGTELWSTNGTTGGTAKIAALSAINNLAVSAAAPFSVVGALFYFLADDGDGGRLYQSDGSPSGTSKISLAQITTPGFADINQLAAYKNKIYFSADMNNTGFELWEYDPASVVTASSQNQLLTNLFCYPNPASSGLMYLLGEVRAEKVILIDAIGRQMECPVSNQSFSIDNLAAGCYQALFFEQQSLIGVSRILVK